MYERPLHHAPSAKRIAEWFGIDPDTARKVRGYMNGTRNAETYSPAVQRWVAQCYNRPDWLSMALLAINEVLSMHGVEPIRGESWDRYYGDVVASYCNSGDTYDATALYCYRTHRWLLTSLGDYVERNSKRYAIA